MNSFGGEKRVGVAVWPGTPARETLRVGRLAEEAGFDSVWVTESTLSPGRDSISILGALSTVTSRLRIGTGIVNVFTRTPTLIASTAATLDELSDGRMMLGLGTGHRDAVSNWHSVPFEMPLPRLREYVESIRAILAGGPVNYKGKTVKIQDFSLAVSVQRPVPIYVAAVGPGTARLAGEVADGMLITMNTLPQVKKLLDIATTAARDRGRILDVAAYVLSFISQDHGANMAMARRVLAMYCSAPFYNKVFVAAEYDQQAREIARLWALGDEEAACGQVSDQMVRSFAALGINEVRRMVEKCRDAGVALPIVSLVHPDNFEANVSRLFSEISR